MKLGKKRLQFKRLNVKLRPVKTDRFYNKTQLRMGKKVELEHTPSGTVAKMIAKHHLDEVSDYYTRLKQMEKTAGVKP